MLWLVPCDRSRYIHVNGYFDDWKYVRAACICYVRCLLSTRHGIHLTERHGTLRQYINRVRANIHIVLCMSPLGEAFRTRLRMFPSIVNCCTIDWFMEWPDEVGDLQLRSWLVASS